MFDPSLKKKKKKKKTPFDLDAAMEGGAAAGDDDQPEAEEKAAAAAEDDDQVLAVTFLGRRPLVPLLLGISPFFSDYCFCVHHPLRSIYIMFLVLVKVARQN
jgi:hypothetical protein